LTETASASEITECDVAVVGAGVAGLAAMRLLETSGLSTCVLEARPRIGGRIMTVRDPRLPHAIELGAEFIHGSAPEVVDLVKEVRLVASDIKGCRWRMHGGRLARLDHYWKRLHQVMRYLESVEPDQSFAEFIRDRPGGRGAVDARKLACSFVEGFHAADLEEISVKALADGGSPSEDPDEQRMMRIFEGYDRIPEWLSRDLREHVLTDTVVEKIDWEPGRVELSCRGGSPNGRVNVRARAAIVTVPLGVLFASPGEAGAISFSPSLAVIEEIRPFLTMGAVQRVVMLFHDRWWTDRLKSKPSEASLDDLSFLHGDTEDFPIWWTLYPAHLPVMVGWTGGPRAAALARLSSGEIKSRAILSLAKNFGVSRPRVESHLEECWSHNWQLDPYSRGAYSYARVGGAHAAKRLARSIEGTIWLAGEAADSEGRNGTVNGAIGSGRAAAESVVRSQRKQ
jgi:monoamine oxidase